MKSAFERLEARLCLSATLTDGLLTVEGTDAADNIRIVRQAGQIIVREAAGVSTTTFPAADVDEIVVNAHGGNDRIRVDRLNTFVAVTLNAGAGNDRVYGGPGDDVINGGDGDDRLYGRGGNDEIHGDAGNDWLFGDLGDDELDGGDGADRVSGGFGFDTSDVSTDFFFGVENFPGLPPGFVPDTGLRSRFNVGREISVNLGELGSIHPLTSQTVPVTGLATIGNINQAGFSVVPNNLTFPPFNVLPVDTSMGGRPPIMIDTTGLSAPAVGVSTINPNLSSQPSGNTVFRDSTGVLFVSSGNVQVPLRPVKGL